MDAPNIFTASAFNYSPFEGPNVTVHRWGDYSFTSVGAGSYYLVFTLPPSVVATAQDQGTDDNLDSDIDASGHTAVFTLAAAPGTAPAA